MPEKDQRFLEWLNRPDELRAAAEFTSAGTGFVPALIEKDFWCSLVLSRLFADRCCPLVFKGGTLLSKAYAGFNRLSEDLDFTLPSDDTTTRRRRSARARETGQSLAEAFEGLPVKGGEWVGFNNSTQHQAMLEYASVFGGSGTIKLEIGQRETPLRPVRPVPLSMLLRDPLFDEPAVAPVAVPALDALEAYAEKVRATLTRKDPAPRDLFDLHYAVMGGVLDWDNGEFLDLAARKVAGEESSGWLRDERIEAFRRRLASELRPVLRPPAFEAFDFDAALATMTMIAKAVKRHLPDGRSNAEP